MYKTSQKTVKYHWEKLGHRQMELDTVFMDGKQDSNSPQIDV